MVIPFFKRIVKRDKGVTLLIALVVVAVVVVVSATLAAVSFRELRISAGVSESMKAFYAQEAGTECARYWALQNNDYFRPGGEGSIECNGEPHSINTSSGIPSVSTFSFGYSDPSSEVDVEVTRRSDHPFRDLSVRAEGYSAPAGASNRAQWYRETEILGICELTPDFMLTVDHSGSIGSGGSDCDATPGAPDCELETMRAAMNNFVDRLMPQSSDNDVYMGRVVFGRGAAELRKELSGVPETIGGNKRGGNTPMADGVDRTKEEFEDEGREGDEYSDFMVLLTDGAPNHSTLSGFGENPGSLQNLQHTEIAVNAIKDEDVDVFVFAIGLNNDDTCVGYTSADYPDVEEEGNCGEWLNKVVAGDSENLDHSTEAPFFYQAPNTFEDIGEAFSTISTCVTPKVDK